MCTYITEEARKRACLPSTVESGAFFLSLGNTQRTSLFKLLTTLTAAECVATVATITRRQRRTVHTSSHAVSVQASISGFESGDAEGCSYTGVPLIRRPGPSQCTGAFKRRQPTQRYDRITHRQHTTAHTARYSTYVFVGGKSRRER